jgi:hypothetical protein
MKVLAVAEKRFVGFMATHEGTGSNYHEVVHKLYCKEKSCTVKGRYYNCTASTWCGELNTDCENLIDEVVA